MGIIARFKRQHISRCRADARHFGAAICDDPTTPQASGTHTHQQLVKATDAQTQSNRVCHDYQICSC